MTDYKRVSEILFDKWKEAELTVCHERGTSVDVAEVEKITIDYFIDLAKNENVPKEPLTVDFGNGPVRFFNG